MLPLVEDVLKNLAEQPILLAFVVLVMGAVIFFTLKAALRIMAIVLLGVLAVAGFYYISDVEQPDSIKRLAENAEKRLEESSKKAKEVGKKLGEKIGKEVGKAAKSGFEKVVNGSD